MKLLKQLDLKSLLIFALIIIILVMRMCSNPSVKPQDITKIDGKKYEIVKRTVDTIKTQVKTIEYRPGEKIYVKDPIYVNVPADVDTAKILKDYYAKRIYLDTLKLKDDLGYVVVNDTISKNSIIGRTWNANVNKTLVKEQVIVKEPARNQLYLGVSAGFDNKNIVNYAGPSLIFKTKNDKIYSLGIGYSGDKTVAVQGGIYWKIKLTK